MAKHLCAAIVFLVWGVSAGCGGSDGGGGPVADVPAESQDAAGDGLAVPEVGPDAAADGVEVTKDPMLQFTNATCEKLVECGPTFLEMHFGGLEACKVREYETVKPLLDLPGLDVDWAACAGASQAMTCQQFIRQHIGETPIADACAWTGSLKDGEPCSHPYQCEGRICARTAGSSCGTCASALPDGADCEGSYVLSSACGIGSACAGGKCVQLGDTGDSCDPSTAPCFSDLGCVDGKCGPPRKAGEKCKLLTGECDLYGQGLVCHLALGTCVPLGLAGPDGACGLTETAAVVCKLGTCYPSALAGTCTAQAADGDPCDPEVGPDCQIHAQCVSGTCEQFFTPVCQ